MTHVLRKSLEDQGLNADKLLEDFAAWRAGDEFRHPFFGKDSAYGAPKVDGQKNILRHVHLIPLNDLASLKNGKRTLVAAAGRKVTGYWSTFPMGRRSTY